MKTRVKMRAALSSSILVLCAGLMACKLSTEELAKQVKANIAEELKKSDTTITVKSFNLVHKQGNEYEGLLETQEPNGTFRYTVKVIYDGDTFKWEIRE